MLMLMFNIWRSTLKTGLLLGQLTTIKVQRGATGSVLSMHKANPQLSAPLPASQIASTSADINTMTNQITTAGSNRA